MPTSPPLFLSSMKTTAELLRLPWFLAANYGTIGVQALLFETLNNPAFWQVVVPYAVEDLYGLWCPRMTLGARSRRYAAVLDMPILPAGTRVPCPQTAFPLPRSAK